METITGLEQVVLQDAQWAGLAQRVIAGECRLEEVVAVEAEHFIEDHLQNGVTLADIRKGMRYANALDAEAVKLHGADLGLGEQREERTARRILHHVARTALVEENKRYQALTGSNVQRNRRRMLTASSRRFWQQGVVG